MSNDFRRDLAWSEDPEHEKFWERTYREAFPDFLNCMRTSGKNLAQEQGTDRVIVTKQNRLIRIEEKQRKQYRPDILLEYKSSAEANTPGWVEKDLKIHYLAYAFMDIPLVYLFPWALLQQAWRANKTEWLRLAENREWGFQHVVAANDGYATWSVAVPTRQLLSALEEIALTMNPVLVVGKEPEVVVEDPEGPFDPFELQPPKPKAVDVIAEVLSERPDTRTSVLRLLFAVWERQGLSLSPAQRKVVDHLIQPETIRRASRKMMNEEGRFKKDGDDTEDTR